MKLIQSFTRPIILGIKKDFLNGSLSIVEMRGLGLAPPPTQHSCSGSSPPHQPSFLSEPLCVFFSHHTILCPQANRLKKKGDFFSEVAFVEMRGLGLAPPPTQHSCSGSSPPHQPSFLSEPLCVFFSHHTILCPQANRLKKKSDFSSEVAFNGDEGT